MIVDSSALLAVVFRDPGYEALVDRLAAAPVVVAGTPTLAETGIVLSARLGPAAAACSCAKLLLPQHPHRFQC
jgi:ribonuclease VapC